MEGSSLFFYLSVPHMDQNSFIHQWLSSIFPDYTCVQVNKAWHSNDFIFAFMANPALLFEVQFTSGKSKINECQHCGSYKDHFYTGWIFYCNQAVTPWGSNQALQTCSAERNQTPAPNNELVRGFAPALCWLGGVSRGEEVLGCFFYFFIFKPRRISDLSYVRLGACLIPQPLRHAWCMMLRFSCESHTRDGTVTRQQAWVTPHSERNKAEERRRTFNDELTLNYEDIISFLFSFLYCKKKELISRSYLHEVPSWPDLLYKSVRIHSGGLRSRPRVTTGSQNPLTHTDVCAIGHKVPVHMHMWAELPSLLLL